MKRIGIIGGTTLSRLAGEKVHTKTVNTPFGETSAPYGIAEFHGVELVFLSRHGVEHSIPPHLINYRANLWGLHQLEVEAVVAFATVGGITPRLAPGILALPDQLIDYTHGRLDTFYDRNFSIERHIDFTQPYDEGLREKLSAAAASAGLQVISRGTYGVTQGPRLETAAEIRRMARDGCDMVGMTGMPEAALARELALPYACCAVVVNWAAGLSPAEISIEEIRSIAHEANAKFWGWLEALASTYK
ncbi:MAG TPA: S-methyl-5'-thioinosine phosphorylase [Gammaproteobacteria bacterium]|nr:S-methyl-5'-thioinosine phosphorylase [Gammaproteobacteria bacterium]